jgi:hypothetical protein
MDRSEFVPPANAPASRRTHRRLPVVCALWFALTAPAVAAPPGYTVGSPWTGPPGVRRTTADIMENARTNAALVRGWRIHARSRAGFQKLPANPDSPVVADWPEPSPNTGAPAPAGPQTLAVNFIGATLAETGAFPPDSMGAAGPTQFLVGVNGRIKSFNKFTGLPDGVLNASMDTFFNPVMTPPVNNNFTSDPRVRYDRLSRRWFVLIIDVPGSEGTLPNRVLLAVSDSPILTASTVWTFFYFQHDLVAPAGDSGKFADYPTLGIDANALYIGVNVFQSRGQGAFQDTTAFVVRKSSVLGAGPIVVTAFRNLIRKVQGIDTGPYTPQGVDNFDPAASEGYFIGVDAGLYGRMALRRVSTPGGTPAISDNVVFNIPLNGGTISVPHLGNTGGSYGNLDGLDYRLLAACLRSGRLWTTANIAVNNTGAPSGTDTRMGARWYELQGIASGQTPSVVQSGTLYQPSASNTTDATNYWMGTIMVNGQGHAAMGFSVAGVNSRINAGTAGRLAGDPAGTLQAPVLYTASTTAYNPPGDPGSSRGRRWGDYSYTCVDPDDDMTMWTVQQYCHAENSYAVRVVKLLAPPPALPIGCSPSTLAAGTSNVTLAVTGLSTNGSGFFDPGPGFSNRLAAVFVGNGVTVNSLTYSNPTQIRLNVSVSLAATNGARPLTITNPDGQAATSANGLLTITGGNTPPTISGIADQTINEDSATAALSFVVGDAETAAGALSVSATSSNTVLVPLGNIVFGGSGSNRTVTVTPAPNQFGTTTLTVTVTDATGGTASDAFVLTVQPVNDPPSFVKGPNQTVAEDAGPQAVPNWATAISPGPNEAGQTLTFLVVNDNPGLFAAPPAVNSAGTLTYTPAPDANGSANVSVQLRDNGGTASGGSDTSPVQPFTLAVTPVNDAPTLAPIADRVVNEGATLTFTNVAADVDLPPNALTFSLVDPPDGAEIHPTSGVFTWTPGEAQGPGTNLLRVVVSDNGAPSLSTTQSFTVIVHEVNTAPVLAAIPDRTIHAGVTLSFTNSASDTDLPANALTFSLSNAPPGATITASNGVFTWTPAGAAANTTNTITVLVSDDGQPSLSDAKEFTVTVVPPPLITSITRADDEVTIAWTAIPGQGYRVRYATNVDAVVWFDLAGVVTADGPTATKTNTITGETKRFYQVVVEP